MSPDGISLLGTRVTHTRLVRHHIEATEDDPVDPDGCYTPTSDGPQPAMPHCHWDFELFGLVGTPLNFGFIAFGGQTTGIGVGIPLSLELVSNPRHRWSVSGALGLIWAQLATAYGYAVAPDLWLVLGPTVGSAIGQTMLGGSVGAGYEIGALSLQVELGWSRRWYGEPRPADDDGWNYHYRYHGLYMSLALVGLFVD